MKLTIRLFLTTLFFVANIAIAEQQNNLAPEKVQWEGKYAFNEIEDKDFFETFAIKERLRALLPEELH